MFLQVSISPRGGGGCLPQCMLGCHTPQKKTPLEADTPQSRHTPWSRHPPRGTHPPGSRHPPGADTPQKQTSPRSRHPPGSRHPPTQSMLGDTVNAWTVRILLECNLVKVIFIGMRQYDHRNQSQWSLTAYYQNRNRNMNRHRSWAVETHH